LSLHFEQGVTEDQTNNQYLQSAAVPETQIINSTTSSCEEFVSEAVRGLSCGLFFCMIMFLRTCR
jgi:hypothetical protein